jgi:predicted PurR-regulated permease PerM
VSTDKESRLPIYVKGAIIFIGVLALLTILYIAQHIIVPLVFAVIFAIVLHPIVNFLVRNKVNRVIAIVITLLLTFIVLAAFGSLLFSQASRFSESWPTLVTKFTRILNQTITWASGYFDINAQKIHAWVTSTTHELINISSSTIGQTIINVGSGLVILFLVPVYIFMILFYEPLLLEFIHKLFGKNNLDRVNEIVTQIKTVIQRYLLGLVFEFVIVATLNSAVLLIFGIEYAVLLGIIGALVNVIPYI